MNTLDLDYRNSLLSDINSEVLAHDDNSVIAILKEMLCKLRTLSKTANYKASDFYGVWSDESCTADELNNMIKASRKFKNDIEALYE